MSNSKGNVHYLLGLLECPLRGGFIEFEFHKGDKVSDLLEKVEDVWGENYGWTGRSGSFRHLRLTQEDIFGYGRGWIVACEDTTGAYLVLTKDNLIPEKPPSGGETVEITSYNHLDKSGIRFRGDTEHGVYNEEVFGSPREQYIKIKFRRDYNIPKDKNYDIHLIAIAVVTGG
ncbi:MAG: hypothetical protein MET45_27390 [Nostoc sp. LLA-1]|nr:hypothetical protein [Cyanocohniella sp. LLY]